MLCYGLLTGAGVATGAVFTSQAGLARWFVRRRSLALSVLYSAGAIGGLIAAPLCNRLIDVTGTWRVGWWLLATLSALAAIIVVALVRERPEDLGQHPDGHAQEPGSSEASSARPSFVSPRQWAFGEAVRQPVFWVLLLTLLGSSGGYTLFIAHGVVHLQDLGHSASVGAWAVGVLAASGLIAKLILALLGDRIDPRYIFAAYTAVFGAGLLLIVDARALWQVFCAATCLGIGFGGGYVSLMATLSNYFGMRAFASLAGVAVALNTTLSAVAPKLGGYLYDQGAGYGGAFHVLAAWCVLGAVASFTVSPTARVRLRTARSGS
jgi:MFS family permease